MKKFSLFVCLIILGSIQPPFADPVEDEISIPILTQLASGRPDLQFGQITASPIDGLYRVQIVDGPALYVSADGEFFVSGDLYQVLPGRFVNLSELELKVERKKLLASLKKDDLIVFSPKGEAKAVLNVFTDVDCGYCRKFHQQVPALNDMGIEVRYLAFPRAGIGSASYKKIVSAWCSDDPQTALTQLKNGSNVAENLCPNNPVEEQYILGQKMGISGTPSMVLEDGTLLVGLHKPDELAQIFGL